MTYADLSTYSVMKEPRATDGLMAIKKMKNIYCLATLEETRIAVNGHWDKLAVRLRLSRKLNSNHQLRRLLLNPITAA